MGHEGFHAFVAAGILSSILITTPASGQCSLLMSQGKQPETSRAATREPCRILKPPYTALSSDDKFKIFVRRTYSPYTFASAAANATWAQMWGQWYQYGGGLEGWGKRFGATLADTEARSFIQTFALSSLLHQDPRYFPAPKRRFMPRAWYAATRVVVARSDGGQARFNSAEILGTLFTSSLENAYYPNHDRGFGETMGRFVGALGSDATSNLLREFWPDIKRILGKHEPRKIKQIQERIPMARPPDCK